MIKLNREKFINIIENINSDTFLRAKYILNTVKKVFKDEVGEHYNFHDIHAGHFLTRFDYNATNNEAYLFAESDNYFAIIDKNGEVLGLRSIPIRWFFEDFEDELIAGKKLYEEFQAKNKNKHERLIKSIKSKLTPEEIEAIGL